LIKLLRQVHKSIKNGELKALSPEEFTEIGDILLDINKAVCRESDDRDLDDGYLLTLSSVASLASLFAPD